MSLLWIRDSSMFEGTLKPPLMMALFRLGSKDLLWLASSTCFGFYDNSVILVVVSSCSIMVVALLAPLITLSMLLPISEEL